jgi:hypothetical protein
MLLLISRWRKCIGTYFSNAFLKNYSGARSLETGERRSAVLRKAKIKDTVNANKNAIDTGLYDSSEASDNGIITGEQDGILSGFDLSESSNEILEKLPIEVYGKKQPK